MDRPDFKELGMMMQALCRLDEDIAAIPSGTEALMAEAEAACGERLIRNAAGSLAEISVEELKNSKAGIRTALLAEAGYLTMKDLYDASDEALAAVSGIGEKQVAAVRTVTDEFLRSLARRERLRLSAEEPADRAVLVKMARARNAELVSKDAAGVRDDLHAAVTGLVSAVRIRNRLHWMFSLPKAREAAVDAAEAVKAFFESPLYRRAANLAGLFGDAREMDERAAVNDFNVNSAAFYALAEKLVGSGPSDTLIYSSIPAKLAAEIDAFETDLSGFKGNLRAYQEFGVKYILHQNRVLLGDEMGLGKTVEAAAAMTHIETKAAGSRFLIVCPASVMINWCREIRKFTAIAVHLVHGEGREDAFAAWCRSGGAAVTSYEGLDRIADRIDNAMEIALFVVDEAHYIKNPAAKRTKNVRRLYEESERILLMSGTPLENKVDEMCELIGFVRPDLAPEVRNNALLKDFKEFREILAPVYLRRRREDVLAELPPLTDRPEWCEMTAADSSAYAEMVMVRNFMAMRRVSFLQEDMAASSKACRLAEICRELQEDGRKAVVYSFFLETVRKTRTVLGDLCAGVITGSIPAVERQGIIDRFREREGGGVLVCQIQAGGTGVNIQAASAVIFCEPQIKPSLMNQAISRVYRMGQLNPVIVFHLLCENTVDEAVMNILEGKKDEFGLYAEESVIADAADGIADREWVNKVVEAERQKYLPAVIV